MRMINKNVKITPFRYWCQQTLPLTFDDSLSYMELLSRVIKHLNDAVADVATAEQDIINLHNAFVQLQSYVNDYFQNLNVQTEVDHKIDEMVENGTFDQLLDPIVGSQIAGVVADQIGAVVASQIGDVVAGQIGDVVEEQLPDVVNAELQEVIGDQVTEWLEENVNPVGSAVIVDKSLSISGAAADALRTGNIRDAVFENVRNFKFVNGGINPTTGAVASSNETIVTDGFITSKDAINVGIDSGYNQMICAYQPNGTYVGWYDKTDGTFKQTNPSDPTALYTTSDFYIGDYPQYKFKIELTHDTIAQLTPANGVHANFLVPKRYADEIVQKMNIVQGEATSFMTFVAGGINYTDGSDTAASNYAVRIPSGFKFSNADVWRLQSEDAEVFVFSVFAWKNGVYEGYWNTAESAFVKTNPAVHGNALVSEFDFTDYDGFEFRIVVEAYDGDTISPSDAADIITWYSRISALEEKLPPHPVVNGNYKLRCTVLNGAATYSWVAE